MKRRHVQHVKHGESFTHSFTTVAGPAAVVNAIATWNAYSAGLITISALVVATGAALFWSRGQAHHTIGLAPPAAGPTPQLSYAMVIGCVPMAAAPCLLVRVWFEVCVGRPPCNSHVVGHSFPPVTVYPNILHYRPKPVTARVTARVAAAFINAVECFCLQRASELVC